MTSKLVYRISDVAVSANAFVSVSKSDVKNALFEYFNIEDGGGLEYAVLNYNGRTVLIEARPYGNMPHKEARILDRDLAFRVDRMTDADIPGIVEAIMEK